MHQVEPQPVVVVLARRHREHVRGVLLPEGAILAQVVHEEEEALAARVLVAPLPALSVLLGGEETGEVAWQLQHIEHVGVQLHELGWAEAGVILENIGLLRVQVEHIRLGEQQRRQPRQRQLLRAALSGETVGLVDEPPHLGRLLCAHRAGLGEDRCGSLQQHAHGRLRRSPVCWWSHRNVCGRREAA